MKKYIFILLASATLGLTSCSPFQVRSDYAETANFNSYKTYKIRIDDLKLNDIDKDRVLNELSRQLQSKGLQSGENPDLIINVKANHKKVTDINSSTPYGMWGWGGPFGWGIGMNRTWTSNYNEGAIIVDMVDARSNKLVWQGIGNAEIDSKPDNPEEFINSSTARNCWRILASNSATCIPTKYFCCELKLYFRSRRFLGIRDRYLTTKLFTS